MTVAIDQFRLNPGSLNTRFSDGKEYLFNNKSNFMLNIDYLCMQCVDVLLIIARFGCFIELGVRIPVFVPCQGPFETCIHFQIYEVSQMLP